MRNVILLLLFVSIILCFSSCMSEEERHKENELIKTYSSAFMEQAITQYGNKAKVNNITADTKAIYGSVWPTVNFIAGEDLLGVVNVDGEEFDAIFSTAKSIIYSSRNVDNINSSMKDFFTYLDLAVIHTAIAKNDSHKSMFLPDDVITFEDFIQYYSYTVVDIYVTDNLSKIKESDFDILKDFDFEYDITLIQVEDKEAAERVENDTSGLSFCYDTHPKTYSNETHEYVDAFEYYGIKSSVNIVHRDEHFTFQYLTN